MSSFIVPYNLLSARLERQGQWINCVKFLMVHVYLFGVSENHGFKSKTSVSYRSYINVNRSYHSFFLSLIFIFRGS